MNVNEPGHDRAFADVDPLCGVGLELTLTADAEDTVSTDANPPGEPGRAGTIDDGPPGEQKIKHGSDGTRKPMPGSLVTRAG